MAAVSNWHVLRLPFIFFLSFFLPVVADSDYLITRMRTSCSVPRPFLLFFSSFLSSSYLVLDIYRASGGLAVSMAMHTDDLSSDDDEENRNTVGRGEWPDTPP